MDHEAFQTDSQTTLIAVCFVSCRPPPPPPPPSLPLSVLRQNIWGAFSRTKRNSYCRCVFGSRTHGELCIVSKLLSIHHLIFAPIRGPKMCSACSGFLIWAEEWIPFMVFFHAWDGYWALIGYQAHLSASLSSLSLFSFLFSSASASLSGPPHMPRVTSCSEQQPYLPWKALRSLP